nr:hypothetical protein [Tanacetum cinerariifolium]
MNPVVTQQVALDNSLVAPKKRLKIERNTIKKIKNSDIYNFKLDKKKCRVDTEVFCEIFQICLILPNQEFVELPSEEELLSFVKELGYSGIFLGRQQGSIGSGNYRLKSLWDSQKYGELIPDEMINQDIKDSKAYKNYYDFSTGKGNSKDESHDVNNDDNVDHNANDDDSRNEDDDDYEDTEHDEEYVHFPENCESDDDKENVHEEEDDDLYKDADVKSLGEEYEKEKKDDTVMTDADQMVSQENSYEHVVEDAHVTLTSSQKTESSKQSSSISFYFASKFLILDNVSPVVDEVASMMNVKIRQKDSSTQTPSLFIVPEMAILETSTTHTTTVPPTIAMITPLPQLTTLPPAPTTVSTTTSIPALLDFSYLFRFNQRVFTLEKELSQLK